MNTTKLWPVAHRIGLIQVKLSQFGVQRAYLLLFYLLCLADYYHDCYYGAGIVVRRNTTDYSGIGGRHPRRLGSRQKKTINKWINR